MKHLTYLLMLFLLPAAFAQPTAPSNFRMVYPGPPTPAMVASRNLPTVGGITATEGQIISNVHVVNPTGSCITVTNVANVIIQDSEIGPCGDSISHQGVVSTGATNLIIRRNVIHDAATGAYLTAGGGGSGHPFTFHKNYVYNIRGPFSRGQAIQTNGINSGGGKSSITCNISDTRPGTRYGVDHNLSNVEDHFNLFATLGTDSGANRIEVAYNRARGGHPTSTTGAGFNAGDGGGGNIWVHDNMAVNVRNVGLSLWSGTNVTIDNNRVFMDSTPWDAVDWGNTGCASQVGDGTPCTGNVLSNNLVRAIGLTSNCAFSCSSGTTITGNNFSATALTEAIWDEAWHTSCH